MSTPTTYTAQVESLSDCLDEYEALMVATNGPRPYPVNPDTGRGPDLKINRDAITCADDTGILATVTLRDEAGELQGITVAGVTPHLHYTSTMTAVVDIFVVLPGAQAHGGADVLHGVLMAELKRRGTKKIYMRERHDEAHPLDLAAHGFKAIEQHHTKWIGS